MVTMSDRDMKFANALDAARHLMADASDVEVKTFFMEWADAKVRRNASF